MPITTPTVLHSSAGAGSAIDEFYSVTLTAGAAVGDVVWVFHGTDGGDADPVSPTLAVTDTGGNTWNTFRVPFRNGVTGSTTILMGAVSKLTTALNSGDTVTLTTTGLVAVRRMTLVAASSGVSEVPDQQAFSDPGSSSSLSVGPLASGATAERIVWGFWCSGVRAFTPGSGYTEIAENATSEASANRQLSVMYKIVSSDGAETATATLSSSTTNIGAAASFQEEGGGTPPSSVYMLGSSGVWEPADVSFL